MFARMTTVYIRDEMIDKAIEIYDKSIVPAAQKQKGYCGACLLIDRKTGKGASITYWESEKAALANEANQYYQQQLLKVRVLFSADPMREGYEVTVFDLDVATIACQKS